MSHLFGDLPRPQGLVVPPHLLPGVHPAAARASAEEPGDGVDVTPIETHSQGKII